MIFGCGKLIKFLLFGVNFLLFLLGGIVFGISLWATLDKNFIDHLEEFAHKVKIDEVFVEELSKFEGSLWVLVVAAGLLLFIGFFECCGVAVENSLCLLLFIISLAVLCVVEAMTFLFFFTDYDELLVALHEILVESSQTTEGRNNLLPVEKAFKCCGATVETAAFYKDDCVKADTVGQPDCYSVITYYLDAKSHTVLIFGIILIVVQLAAIALSYRLIREKRLERNCEILYIPQQDEDVHHHDRQFQ